MPKKRRKKQKKVVNLSSSYPTFCGFRLIEKNRNQLWRWDTLEDVKL